ncbi:MAG TPA: hypothetical protein VF657_05775 [Actinoplanes sp.]
MSGIPAPHSGEAFVLQERDYRYGVGPIVAVVISIVATVAYDGEPWWHVEAEAANGTPDNHGGWVRRGLYLRASSIPDARRDFRSS